MPLPQHTRMGNASTLLESVQALGVTPPKTLSDIVDGHRLLQSSPRDSADPANHILDAAAAGELTEQSLTELIAKATTATAVKEYRSLLATQADRKFLVRFYEVLEDGAADEILDGLRPAFTDAAKRLATALEQVDFNTPDAALVANGTPEQLDAWRSVPVAISALQRISNIACRFGMLGDFPQLEDPRDKDVMLRNGTFGAMHDAAIVCTDGNILTDSRTFQQPHPAGDVRTSPWLRVQPVLHTIDDARERLRALGETAWNAMDAQRAKTGRITEDRGIVYDVHRNPFAKPEMAQAKG